MFTLSALNPDLHVILSHVQASAPCTYTSVKAWAECQGYDAAFTENMIALLDAGLIQYSHDEETNKLIVDLI